MIAFHLSGSYIRWRFNLRRAVRRRRSGEHLSHRAPYFRFASDSRAGTSNRFRRGPRTRTFPETLQIFTRCRGLLTARSLPCRDNERYGAISELQNLVEPQSNSVDGCLPCNSLSNPSHLADCAFVSSMAVPFGFAPASQGCLPNKHGVGHPHDCQ
jgi:hypothetical protein